MDTLLWPVQCLLWAARGLVLATILFGL